MINFGQTRIKVEGLWQLRAQTCHITFIEKIKQFYQQKMCKRMTS